MYKHILMWYSILMATKHRNLPNPELAQAMRELGRSSACQRHTPKTRKGTRSAQRTTAIRNQLERN